MVACAFVEYVRTRLEYVTAVTRGVLGREESGSELAGGGVVEHSSSEPRRDFVGLLCFEA